MKFHGITMKGEYKAQIVVDASTLPYTISDERRIVYDQTTKQLWIADSSEWKSAGQNGDIPIGTEMWFYANSAPDGWTLNGTPSDQLLAVEGGSTYTTGGAAAGSFTMPNHSHSLNSHIHRFAGNTSTLNRYIHKGDDYVAGVGTHYHTYDIGSTGPSPSTTDSSGSVAGYRPESHVGIICTKN